MIVPDDRINVGDIEAQLVETVRAIDSVLVERQVVLAIMQRDAAGIPLSEDIRASLRASLRTERWPV